MFRLFGLCCKKSYISWCLLYLFGAVSQSCSERLPPRLEVLSFVRQIKHNSQFLGCAFFLVDIVLGALPGEVESSVEAWQ